MADPKAHKFVGHTNPGTVHGPAEHFSVCEDCGMEEPGSSDEIPACPPSGWDDEAMSGWFELSYAQFLTVPRLVMESMPAEWQARMVALLREMDATFDWRPERGRYWVRLRDDRGRFSDPPLGDYRRGSVEHLRRVPLVPPYEA